MERTALLPGGGKVFYRLPNVIEQLRFFSESGWFEKESTDYWLRMMRALEIARPYVVMVEIPYKVDATIDDVLEDRDNFDVVMEIVRDIAGFKKQVNEEEKKP